MKEMVVNQLSTHFAVMSPKNRVSIETADETVYERIANNYDGFHRHELISMHSFTSDWDVWEMHPHGDEIVILLSGDISVELKLGDTVQSAPLKAQGDYVVVPKGVWHTAKTHRPSTVVFITPGEGTLNQASPD